MTDNDESLACWCGHPERHDAGTALGHAFLESLRLPQLVGWLDRQLRRWPWLYRRLGGRE